MTAYTGAAQVARAYLNRRFNDFDVFVEDDRTQNMYVRLINRMLDGAARITSVYPLGGRGPLLTQCTADQAPGGRKRIYLMDGDLDLLRAVPAPALNRLCRLSVYCSENLLLSEGALLELAIEAADSEAIDDLRARLSIRAQIDKAAEVLMPLFVVYAVAQHLGVAGIETVGYPVVRLCRNPSDAQTLCPLLIRRRMRDVIKATVANSSKPAYQAAKATVEASLSAWAAPKSHLISGKSYLLPLAFALLRRETGLRDSFTSFCVRLALHSEVRIDPNLVAALKAAAA